MLNQAVTAHEDAAKPGNRPGGTPAYKHDIIYASPNVLALQTLFSLHLSSILFITHSSSLVMPERAEIYVQHKHIELFIESTTPEDRRLRALWVDPTADEQALAPAHSNAHKGLVYALKPGDTLRRGQKKPGKGTKKNKTSTLR